MIKEFKEFIQRGNVVELAVGVMIGSAFGKIITSLVDDILMPVIGLFLGGVDFTNLMIRIGESEIKYGSFLQNIIDFTIIAFCIFLFVKIINKMTGKKKEEKETVQIKKEVLLLEEIRDLLKEDQKKKPNKKSE